MRARSILLGLLGGPVLSHLWMSAIIGRLNPGSWDSGEHLIAITIAAPLGGLIAHISEELADA